MATRNATTAHPDAAQANTAMTTDGFKNEAVKGGATDQLQDAATTTAGDGDVQAVGGAGQPQQAKKKGDKNAKVSEAEPADEQLGQQQGNKLRGMFGRPKKGSEEGEAKGEGEEGSETKARVKVKGDVKYL
ncbi:hypothetical protein F5Y10DRAFT_254335 [Nemania abortiva]|nr:hypothetical protein F5Y10DRAFT_254335 [Nemania abortiva]